ncbi:hypothetical protein NQZ68_003916 [Dissostichus eleginoides]|nr:hypothetical protein NQZ68_003916 [Dissostichus eleginoides]
MIRGNVQITDVKKQVRFEILHLGFFLLQSDFRPEPVKCSLYLRDVWHHNCSLQRTSPVYLLLICCGRLWRTKTVTNANLIIITIIITIIIINVCHFKHQDTRGQRLLLADQRASSHKAPVDHDSCRAACVRAA